MLSRVRNKIMKQDNQKSQIVIYKSPAGETKIDVRFDGGTVWLTQNALAELFQTTKNNISIHVKNIFKEGELVHSATVKEYLTVQKEGKREVSRDLAMEIVEKNFNEYRRIEATKDINFDEVALRVLASAKVKKSKK